jgi:hypothetical protein
MRLGSVQREVLRALVSHDNWELPVNGWAWWVWDTPSNTKRIMDALVRKQLATRTEHGDGRIEYRPTRAGVVEGTR